MHQDLRWWLQLQSRRRGTTRRGTAVRIVDDLRLDAVQAIVSAPQAHVNPHCDAAAYAKAAQA